MALTETCVKYNRLKELKEFDESRSGVKGIVDNGVKEIPRIFVRPVEDIANDCPVVDKNDVDSFSVPVIDLCDLVNDERRIDVVDAVRAAAQNVGFFQVVNHGIPLSVLEGILRKVSAFHELPKEEKMKFYGREWNQRVKYTSNFDLYKTKSASWRDTITFVVDNENPINPSDMPEICRDEVIEYNKNVDMLLEHLFGLLSEALGLETNYLINYLESGLNYTHHCHYYPACPQPELTLGVAKHTDPGFITLLIKDHKECLQVLHHNKWVDVVPLDGAIIINIANLLQLISNDKFKSAPHRAVATVNGPRLSVATFVGFHDMPKKYGPIKELISENESPVYMEVTGDDYIMHHYGRGLDAPTDPLEKFKLNK